MSPLWRVALGVWGGLLPSEFREALVGDLSEGFGLRRKRGRWVATLWLLGEVLRTPYLRLWRQARKMSGRGVPDRDRSPIGWARGEGLWRTVRIAVRVLTRRPGFAAVAVATLALSVGAATVIFGLLEAVLLRPLPYPDADRLYTVYGTNEAWRDGEQEFLRSAWDRAGVSIEMVRSWDALGSMRVASYQGGSLALRVGDGPAETVSGARIGNGFFATLGVEPLVGRTPSPAEHRDGAPVLVIHERLWSRDFARDPEILGKTAVLDGRTYTIVGVMPRPFAVPAEGSLWWAPFPPEWAEYGHATILSGLARLPAHTTAAAATESMNAAVERLASAEPSYGVMGARLVPLRDEVLGSVSGGLRLLFAAVCVVVLIACVNLANLVVARGARRMPELALRAALGAGRRGLVATMLTEVGLVCLVGAVLGVALAAGALGPLVDFLTRAMPDFPRAADVSLNVTVLGFSLAVTVLTAVLAGLPPALAAARSAPARILQGSGRGGRSRSVRRIQSTLLFAEAGLAMLLLAGAGLLTRSMARVFTLDPGFDSRGVAYASVELPEERFPEDVDALQALDALEAALSRVPGVTRVVEASPLPAMGGSTMVPVRPDGAPDDEQSLVVLASVGPSYFETLSIPVLGGRTFEASDDGNSEPVAIVSASLARRLFGDDDPLGRFIVQADGAVMMGGRAEAGSEKQVEVVGVVEDVRQLALVREGDPVLYRPFRQTAPRDAVLALATQGSPTRLLEPARAAAAEVDGIVIRDLGAFRDRTLRLLAPVQLRVVLMGALSALAAALAMVGVYGVVSYVVSDQRREIGIRIALGARKDGETIRMVRGALTPCLAGACVGVLAALALSRTLESSIFEISRLDPVTYVATFLLLLTVAALASWWPARRATRVDPVEVLNRE